MISLIIYTSGLLANTDIDLADKPRRCKNAQKARKDGDRFSESCPEWVVVGNDEGGITRLINDIYRGESERCTTQSIHERAMCGLAG